MVLDITAIQALRAGGPSPFQRTQQGFQFGQKQRQAQLEAQQAQAELQAKQDRQLATRAALSDLAGKENPTGQDFARIMIDFPEVAEQLKQPFEIMSAEERKIATTQARNVFSAIESGNIDVARTILEDQRDAARNSGDEEEAVGAEIILKALDADPGSALAAAGLAFSAATGPEEFDNTLSELRARRSDERIGELEKRKLAADLDLTEAQVNTATKGLEKMGIEIQKDALELEALKSGNQIISPEKKFTFAKDLRAEFNKLTSDSREIEDAVINIRNTPDSGAGDISLITAFMKMIDPGSTVREGEFATAKNAGGVPDKFKNFWNQLVRGDKLGPAARKATREAAEVLFQNSRKRIEKEKKRLGPVIKNFGINPENVFGPIATEEEVPAGAVADMSDEELSALRATLEAEE